MERRLHDMFFRAIIKDSHAHFITLCNGKQGDALFVKFRTDPFLRIQPQINCFFLFHRITSYKVCRRSGEIITGFFLQNRCQ